MQDQVLTAEAKQMFESLIPRGTMGLPEEIAATALFLASDDSSFVNGVELAVDGGFRSEEHTSELQSLMRISYAVFCLKKKNKTNKHITQKHKYRHICQLTQEN